MAVGPGLLALHRHQGQQRSLSGGHAPSLLSLSVHGNGVSPQIVRSPPGACLRPPEAGRCGGASPPRRQFSGPSCPLSPRCPAPFPWSLPARWWPKSCSVRPQLCHCSGPGKQSPHLIVEGPGRAAPVHGGQGPAEHGRQRHLTLLLGGPGGGVVGQMLHRLHQQFRPQTGQPVMEGLHRLVRVNGGGPLGNDIPRRPAPEPCA